MHRVIKTQHPSIKQIKNMTANLRNKFNTPSNIQVVSFSSTSGNDRLWFWLSVVGHFAGNVETWERLQLQYKLLMRRKR